MKKRDHHNPTIINPTPELIDRETVLKHPFVKDYIADLRGRRYRKGTIDKRLHAVRMLFDWLRNNGDSSTELRTGPQLHDVTPRDIEKFHVHQSQRGIAAATADSIIADNKKFFQFLEESQRIFISPMSKTVIRWAPRGLKPVPTEEEMERLLAAPETSRPVGIRDRALLETMYSTGARMGELLHMTIFDPDLDKGTVRVLGKGRKERVVPLGKQAVLWIQQYLKAARPKLLKQQLDVNQMWLGQSGTAIKKSRVDQIVKEHAATAQLKTPMSSHAVRRACATHMLRNGAHPVQIQLLLGHATLNTVSQYLQVTITDMQKMHEQSKPGR